MPMREQFAVQLVAGRGGVDKSRCIHVDALSPVQAAEMALGETLVCHGAPDAARALVWRLGADYLPVSTRLFRAE
jgi:hypothetical protein